MRKKYEKDFKIMIVELINTGQTVQSISEEYGLNDNMIRRWRREHSSDRPFFTGNGVVSLTDSEKEVKELKKQLREAQIEVEILKKAMGIVSKSERRNITY